MKKMNRIRKVGWLRRLFARWVNRAHRDMLNEFNEEREVSPLTSAESMEVGAKSCVRFTIYPASGGHVIQYYTHNYHTSTKTGYEGPSLVIVNHGDDLGKAVEHIIAIEALRT